MVAKIVKFFEGNDIVEDFLKRPAFDESAEAVAMDVLKDIETNGIDAVLSYVEKFDGTKLDKGSLRVSEEEIARALPFVDDKFKSAVQETKARIKVFSEAGMKRDWSIDSAHGGKLGEKFVPFDRVGVYVPGGAAPLVSTALMTAYIAKVAGVKEIVACTPMGKDGELNPIMLYGLKEAGVTEIYKVGGIQAIGLMAYGVEGVKKVQKIVGPGGTFVTAAKRQVYGQVSLDLVAGPSEIAILADAEANPAFVAADLLSQAEHGSGFEKSLLVTDSMDMAEAVNMTSGRFAHGVDEFKESGLTPVKSKIVKPYRVKESPIHLECRLYKMITMGEEQGGVDAIFGEVVHVHVEDELFENGKIDIRKLKPVARLAGTEWSKLGEIFSLDRPNI